MRVMPKPEELSAPKLLRFIKGQDELIATLRKNIQCVLSMKYDNLKVLGEKIRKGKTTGMELEDYLALHKELMRSEDFSEGFAALYLWGLAVDLAGAKDEPVFIVHWEQRESSSIYHLTETMDSIMESQGLMPPPDPYRTHYVVEFGVLDFAELFFDLDIQKSYICVQSWQRLESQQREAIPSPDARKVTTENLEIFLPPLHKLVLTKQHPEHRDAQEVVVGTAAVKAWLANCADYHLKQELISWLKSIGITE